MLGQPHPNKLLKLLQKTIKDVSAHITVDCELCKAKGYLCEVIDPLVSPNTTHASLVLARQF